MQLQTGRLAITTTIKANRNPKKNYPPPNRTKPSSNRKLQLKQPEGGQLVQQLQKRNIRIRDFIITFICNSIATRLPSFMTDPWSHQGKTSIQQCINTGPVRINRRQITNYDHCCNIYEQNLPPSRVKPEKEAKHKGKD